MSGVTQPVFRFAPSPNGRLHLGHAYSALLNADLAARRRGRLLLRIEDIDVTRCRSEFEQAIYEDLAWLGVGWEQPVRRQSEHFAEYGAAAERLTRKGLLYPCFCSRSEIAREVAGREADTGNPWPRDPDGAPIYPGTCRALARQAREGRLASGIPHAWRLDLTAALAAAPGPHAFTAFWPDGTSAAVATDASRWGDAVIVRKEIPTSYHLSVVLDDAVQAVTHVVRGADLEAATDLHVLLQAVLELPTPAYHHHRLVRDEEGDKLSKSLGSQPLAEWRRRGVSASEVRAALGFPEPRA